MSDALRAAHHQADGAQAQRRARGHRHYRAVPRARRSLRHRPDHRRRRRPQRRLVGRARQPSALSAPTSCERVMRSARSPRGPTALARDGMHELGRELGERHRARTAARTSPGRGSRRAPRRLATPYSSKSRSSAHTAGSSRARPASASTRTQARRAPSSTSKLGGQRQHEIQVVRRPGRRRPRCDRRSSSEPRRTAARARRRGSAQRAFGIGIAAGPDENLRHSRRRVRSMTMPTSRAAGIAPGFATDTFTHGAPNSRTTIRPIAFASASTI